ncbi:MAG: V-type ATP synthase subunit D [Candidatus Omnitrophota bacterium]
MAKLRLTKNELKKQKDSLKRFRQYLPTLILKKQQLQAEIIKLNGEIDKIKQEKAFLKAEVYKWVDVFAEKQDLKDIISLKTIETEKGNIAGIDIPVFVKAVFNEAEYDILTSPLWQDFGVEAVKKEIELNSRIEVLRAQQEAVREELRITTQRVNLFEKVMIPETKGKIKKIQVYLGDMQTASVVTGKIAKSKIMKAEKEKVPV